MAELTPQDEKNYEELKNAFSKHNKEKDTTEAIKKIVEVLAIDTKPKNTDELFQKVDALELYLKILKLLKVDLFKVDPKNSSSNPENEEEKKKLEQEFLNSLEEIKRSLQVDEDENLDLTQGIEKFQPDSLFLDLITGTNPKKWTETLIDDGDPRLNEEHIGELTSAWGTAVTTFVEDARKRNVNQKGETSKDDKVIPLQPETFAHFFRIHKELEVLYSRLANSETVRESEI